MPSCGASLSFTSSISLLAVCPSAAAWHAQGLELETWAKVAQLQPDGSLLQLGARGSHKGRRHRRRPPCRCATTPAWNEWFLRSRTRGRLARRGAGALRVSFQPGWEEPPAGTALSPGRRPARRRDLFRAGLTSEVRLGEGELPFKPPLGESAKRGLRGPGGRFATLDYSDDPPLSSRRSTRLHGPRSPACATLQ